MSIIANIFVLIFHHKNVRIQKPMPRWVKLLICIYMAKFLRMNTPDKIRESLSIVITKSKKRNAKESNELHLFNELNECKKNVVPVGDEPINEDSGVFT